MSEITTDNYIAKNSIFRIGSVVEVVGQAVKIRIDTGKNTSSVLYKGETIQNISVGGYVKIKKDFEEIIGKIEGELITENKESSQKKYTSHKDKVSRILNIKILGYLDSGKFERGIKELPLIDNTCFLITPEEFNNIHQFVDSEDEPIKIGQLEFDESVDVSLGINKLFASHIGIFGNTGSGKSYTLAKIYRQLFKEFKGSQYFLKNANFLIIDFNGEYINNAIIDSKFKNIYDLSTSKNIESIRDEEKYPISKKTIENVTFWSIFLSATEKTQQPFLSRAIKKSDVTENNIEILINEFLSSEMKKIERGTIFNFLDSISEFLQEYINIETLRSKLHYHGQQNTYYVDAPLGSGKNVIYANNSLSEVFDVVKNILGKITLKKLSSIKNIELKIIFNYYREIIKGYSNIENLSPLIKRLTKRISDLEKVLTTKNIASHGRKNLTVVSLRNVNIDIRKMLPMLLVKEMYDKQKNSGNKSHSLHIIVDEAHNILSSSSDRESKEWKDYRLETFEEIIKEGRKFNVFMTIASQRPSDISPTIISQLHNYFLHRLINNNDLLAVEKTISYLDKVSADTIPNLATGTCILAGLMAKIPVIIRVAEITNIKNQPQSHNIDLVKKWKMSPRSVKQKITMRQDTDTGTDII